MKLFTLPSFRSLWPMVLLASFALACSSGELEEKEAATQASKGASVAPVGSIAEIPDPEGENGLMQVEVVVQQYIAIGSNIVIEGKAPGGSLGTVFEDNGETGYFYALDYSQTQQPIRDAVQIYRVNGIMDSHLPSEVKIGWSADYRKAVLLINEYPHAVFDFSTQRAYCRSGFPPPRAESGWKGHEWDDRAIGLFAARH